MFDSKYSKMLTILMIAGIVIIVLVLGIAGFLIIRSGNQKQNARETVEQFQGQIKENLEKENNEVKNEVEIDNVEVITPIINEVPVENTQITPGGSSTGTNTNTNTTKTYKGFPMAGTIEIPSIKLSYPVLRDTSKTAMEISLTVFDGPGLNEIGNTTIAGHNYRNGTMLSDINKIAEGDKIYITDASGKTITYIVYKAPYITGREDSSYLERDTQGKREITLTSCTSDAKNIYVLWAKEQ